MADKPKFNKRTGLYGGHKNPRRPSGGGFLSGIGDAVKGLVGATPAGDKRRAGRAARRNERKRIRSKKKDLKQQYRNLGASRGDARRMAKANAPEQVRADRANKLAENQRKRDFKKEKQTNKPISLEQQSTESQLPKYQPPGIQGRTTSAPTERPNLQGQNMGGDMKKMMEEGRFDYKNPNYVGSYAQDIHGTSQRVGQFNKTIDINSKQGKKMARELYSKRFQGNKKAKLDAIKAGKDSFDYVDPHTGQIIKMKTSKVKTTTKRGTNTPVHVIKNK